MSKKLIDSIVALKALVGMDANAVQDELEKARVQRNDNEVMHTTNTGKGAELVPSEVQSDSIIDMVPKYMGLLNFLPGNHGTGLPKKETYPVIGEAGLFSGNSEWTDGSNVNNLAASDYMVTGKVSIEQSPFILNIPVSKRELNYGPAQLESILRDRISMSALRTASAFILNADSASSGNVNLEGATPATTLYYTKGDNGIRKVAIANTVVDVGGMDEDDLLKIIDVLGEYASDISNCLWIVNRNVYNKMLGFTNMKTYDKAKDAATIASGVLSNIWGIDVHVARDMPTKAQASGKVHTTAGNNTTGQIALIYTPAIQYGFGQEQEIEVTKIAGKGTVLTATFEFGFAVVDEVAGQGKTVALGANVTL